VIFKRSSIRCLIWFAACSIGGTATASPNRAENVAIKFFTVSGKNHAMIETKDKFWNDENNPLHPWCKGRFYIQDTDPLILKQAMAASLAGRKVSFWYEDNAAEVTFAGHSTTKCQIFSLWF
jgi:hypothetical protein